MALEREGQALSVRLVRGTANRVAPDGNGRPVDRRGLAACVDECRPTHSAQGCCVCSMVT